MFADEVESLGLGVADFLESLEKVELPKSPGKSTLSKSPEKRGL